MGKKYNELYSVANAMTSNGKVIDMVFNGIEKGKNPEAKNSSHSYKDIPLDDITPRSINTYSQRRIDRLAQSIRNTGNRLIHPIVVANINDYPKDHPVVKQFEQKGVDISTLKYIIVAGERRYRAFLKLREEENNRPDRDPFDENPFDRITANILYSYEIGKEEAFYEDSNTEVRQLTPIDAIRHIKSAMDEINTPEKKAAVMVEMGKNPNKRFNEAEYCNYYIKNDLGIDYWTDGSIAKYLGLINKCDEKVVKAVEDGIISEGQTRKIRDFKKQDQVNLLQTFIDKGEKEFESEIEKLKGKKNRSSKTLISHKEIRNQMTLIAKTLTKQNLALKDMESQIGGDTKKVTKSIISKLDKTITDIYASIDELK